MELGPELPCTRHRQQAGATQQLDQTVRLTPCQTYTCQTYTLSVTPCLGNSSHVYSLQGQLATPPKLFKNYDAGELPGVWNLGQSYLALDTDSRVVRLDSFAKFLAPGFRLGWVTAHPMFVDKLTWHMHGTALGPCSTTQVGHCTSHMCQQACMPQTRHRSKTLQYYTDDELCCDSKDM